MQWLQGLIFAIIMSVVMGNVLVECSYQYARIQYADVDESFDPEVPE